MAKTYEMVENLKIDATIPDENVHIKNVTFKIPSGDYQYVKIVAKKLGELPKWHLGYQHDGRSWLFIDEINIKLSI